MLDTLTRNDYIHLRNMLEDRINEQYDLFLELTSGGDNGISIKRVVDTLVGSISKNVKILVKIADVTGTEPFYDDQWLDHVQSRKVEWQHRTTTDISGKRGLRTLCARYFSSPKNLIGGRS